MREFVDYEGRRIRLTDERHAHILEHPEMAGMDVRIAETLGHPLEVVESLSDSDARLYYRYYVGTRIGGKYLSVVVKILPADAFVVTAYLTDRVKSGKVLWPREK